MIRSSALYISLIISILIVLVCGSMLLIGYTYKMEERKYERMDLLNRNAGSAKLILMGDDFIKDSVQRTDLFGNGDDSVLLEKRQWGAYELGLVKSYANTDTVKNAFLIGALLTDTLKVLYLTDEDRPVSISGKSKISGTAYLPKSGIRAAYVDGTGYEDRTLIYGAIKDSERMMPLPDKAMLKYLNALLETENLAEEVLPDTLSNSFFYAVKRIHQHRETVISERFKAHGNVIISSDSLIEVIAGSMLDQVILVAPQVRIRTGFKGRLQVIASDSIVVGDSVKLAYPSALMVLKNDTAEFQAGIKIGKNTEIRGQLFAWEKAKTLLMPIISLDAGTVIKGEVWCKGYVALNKTVRIHGSVSAIRLMAKVSSAIYENYLIDVVLDKTRRSRYYLSSRLMNMETKRGGLLCKVN